MPSLEPEHRLDTLCFSALARVIDGFTFRERLLSSSFHQIPRLILAPLFKLEMSWFH